MAIDLNDELVQEFLVEADETVGLLSEKLVELEQSAEDVDLLNQVFRSFHNIKGGGGFLGLDELVKVCHSAEEVFDRLRTGALKIDGVLMDSVLEATDVIGDMISVIRQGVEPKPADPALLEQLADYASLRSAQTTASDQTNEASDSGAEQPAVAQEQKVRSDPAVTKAAVTKADVVTLQPSELVTMSAKDAEYSVLADAYDETSAGMERDSGADEPASTVLETTTESISSSTPDIANDEISDDEFDVLLDNLPGLRGGPVTETESLSGKSESGAPALESTEQAAYTRSDQELGDLLQEAVDSQPAAEPESKVSEKLKSDEVKPEKIKDSEVPVITKKTSDMMHAEVADSTIRVDTKGLDDIMNMVGELVLARNRLSTLDADLGNEHLTQAVNNLSLVASDLQTLVMKTRMQPIKKAFGRFPRVVRDLARSMKKEIHLEMIGEDTALDKTLVDALADPLVHLVRNSVDHGIEMPEDRVAAGKPRGGFVRLMAAQKGDHIQVGVADDGAGLDADKLRQKAIDKGLISAEAANRMSREECFNLIFMPGFTTKDVASNVSGRGVGMDVVKTRIGQFNGSVSIESEFGAGTVIYIKVPLTLAIMPTLMVKVAGHIYAIPLLSIQEILEYDENSTKRVDGQTVLLIQDKAVPIYSLRSWLTPTTEVPQAKQPHLVLVGIGSAKYGLVVDDLVGQEEVVIKPLGKLLHGTPGLVGATITGDGEIALILDILGLISHYASLYNMRVA